MHLRNTLAKGMDAESYSLHTFEALLSQSMENLELAESLPGSNQRSPYPIRRSEWEFRVGLEYRTFRDIMNALLDLFYLDVHSIRNAVERVTHSRVETRSIFAKFVLQWYSDYVSALRNR